MNDGDIRQVLVFLSLQQGCSWAGAAAIGWRLY